MTTVAVIPARYDSTRFPGKPLANATGKFLIQHVCERVAAAREIKRTIVATDDDRIVKAVKSFGGEVRLTRADHVSGTDRVGEVAAGLQLADSDLVLNVQGDEPEIDPASLDQLVERMLRPFDAPPIDKPDPAGGLNRQVSEQGAGPTIGTIAAPFDPEGPRQGAGSPLDPNCVKVVVDADGRALYFSRSPIPYPRDTGGTVDVPSRWLLHMGVYAFRAAALRAVTGGKLPPSHLEKAESLEQLRWLENGLRIAVVIIDHRSLGIDTPQDYAAFVRRQQGQRSGAEERSRSAGEARPIIR